jgi:electron transfer flavoprotein beta subunit
MNIAVFIKSVIATDEPIVVQGGEIEDSGVKKIINPYDEYGLEEALRLKEAGVAEKVTAISAGPEKTVEVLRTALAMGADEAIWINTMDHDADEHTLSTLLAGVVRLKGCDLVWAGHSPQSSRSGRFSLLDLNGSSPKERHLRLKVSFFMAELSFFYYVNCEYRHLFSEG